MNFGNNSFQTTSVRSGFSDTSSGQIVLPKIVTPFAFETTFTEEMDVTENASSISKPRPEATFIQPTSDLLIFQTQAERDSTMIPGGSKIFIREGSIDYVDTISVLNERGEVEQTSAPVNEFNLLSCGHAFTNRTLIRLGRPQCPICRAPVHGNNISKSMVEIYQEMEKLNRSEAELKDAIIASVPETNQDELDRLYSLEIDELFRQKGNMSNPRILEAYETFVRTRDNIKQRQDQLLKIE